jgi:chaperonin cofactor prefoldin
MDYSFILNIILGVALSIGGWFVRQMWDAVQNLKDDLKRIEVELPTSYVRKSDLDSRLDKLELLLDRIFEKLDNKVDK